MLFSMRKMNFAKNYTFHIWLTLRNIFCGDFFVVSKKSVTLSSEVSDSSLLILYLLSGMSGKYLKIIVNYSFYLFNT